MQAFKAYRIHSPAGGTDARLEEIRLGDLSDGDVVIRGEYSGINYKDALAATGRAKILRRFPLVGGIDIAGTVVDSTAPGIREGDAVLAAGCGLSETRDGGFAQFARVPADAVIPLPEGLDTWAAMAIGTAGLTAALAVRRMQENGQAPEHGPIAVTGATGGVGSIVIDMLTALGFQAVALTGKPESAASYLRDLGAVDVVDIRKLEFGDRPLEAIRWAGGVDNLGGPPLSGLLRSVRPFGNVASIGLAAGHEFEGTVMPFILRGVNLLGITTLEQPRQRRIETWNLIAGPLRPRHLRRIASREVGLDQLADQFQAYIDGQVIGRTVVRLN